MSSESVFTIIKNISLATATVSLLAGCVTDSNVSSSSSVTVSSSSSIAVPESSSSSQNSSSVGSVETSSSSSSSAPTSVDLPLVVAVNAGGGELTMDGITYIADKYAKGGSRSDTDDPITGADNSELYQTERYGEYSYEVPILGDGTFDFTVKLHFAEIYQTGAGERSFSVAIEGKTVISNLDLYAEVGHDTAYDFVAEDIAVSDGALTITLIAGEDNPTLSGFALFSADAVLDESEPEVPVSGGIQFVGNITTGGQVRSDFMQYWDQITPENEGKWGSVEGSRDNYNWGPLDRIYDFARSNNIPIKAHTMVWGSQQPGWIGGLGSSEQAAEIEEWIRDYCTRYPDTPIMDVVNEAVAGHAPAGYAQSAFGSNWITRSFELARTYCPNTTLVYNDYNFMTWNTDEIMSLIRPAVESGYVDALGMQAHSLYDPKVWSADEIKEKLDLISTMGLPIYISEYDIEATNDQTQLQYMQTHFPVFYNHPNVVGITLWGYVVGSTWRNGTGLIQSSGQHRPAMDWLMDYLGR